MYGKGLRPLSLASAATLTAAFALVFFYAPNDADQGFVQKIFYVHVPMAIVALGGFVAAGLMAIAHLRSGDRRWDARSYVAIHLSLILSIGVLVSCAPCGASWRARSRRCRRVAAPRRPSPPPPSPSPDARPAAPRGRQVRGRRLRRLRRADPDLRGDHGRQAQPDRARAGGAQRAG